MADQSHSIVIEIDPTKSGRGASEVAKQVASINTAAQTAQKGVDSLLAATTTGVNGIASATTKAKAELSALDSVAKSFTGISAELKREANILEAIRAPMREYYANVGALIALHGRGAITAQEYATALQRLGTQIERPTTAKAAAPADKSSFAAGAAGGFAALGASKALELVHELPELADSYTNLGNRLRNVSTSQENLNDLMDKTHSLADRTRSDWSTTGEAYTRITKATKDLGLTQTDVLGITETISKAMKLQGASSAEAASSTLQLTQALASGRLAGDEFRTISEAFPDLLDILAKKMNVSRGSLKDLAAEGKITSKVIVGALQEASASVNEAFAKTKPTFADQWVVFKNDLTEIVGKFAEQANLLPVLSSALHGVLDVLTPIAKVLGTIAAINDKLPGSANGPGSSAQSWMPGMGKTLTATLTGGVSMLGDGPSNGAWQQLKAQSDPSLYDAFIDRLKQINELATPTKLDEFIHRLNEVNRILSAKPNKDPFELDKWADHGKTMVGALSLIVGEQVGIVKELGIEFQHTFGELMPSAIKLGMDELSKLGSFDQKVLGAVDNLIVNLAKGRFKDSKFVHQKGVGPDGIPYDNLSYTGGNPLVDDPWAGDLHKPSGKLSREQEMFKAIRGPMIEYMKDETALGNLLHANRITATEYRVELERLFEKFAGKDIADLFKPLDKARAQTHGYLPDGASGPQPADVYGRAEGHPIESPIDLKNLERHNQLVAEATAEYEAQAEAYKPVHDLEKDMADRLPEINRQEKVHLDWMRELKTGLRELATSYAEYEKRQTDMTAGANRAWKSIAAEIQDTASLIEKSLKDAFHGAEDALIKFVMTGKLSLESLMKTLEEDMLRLLLRQGEQFAFGPSGLNILPAIAGAVGGGGGGGGGAPLGDNLINPYSERRSGPVSVHVNLGDSMQAAMVAPRGQAAIGNVVNNSAAIATRLRLRSRG